MTPVGLMALATFLDAMSMDSAGSARSAARRSADAPPPAVGDGKRPAPAATATATARVTAALLAPVPADPAASAGQATLSGLAQLISRVAAGASESAPLPAAVLPSLHAEADALPEAIRHAVQASGLFYESHLEEWVAGRRSLEQLRQEPQGGVPARPGLGTPSAPLPVPQDLRATADAAPAQATAPAAAPAAELDPATARANPPGWHLPAVLEPVVREQLAALAQGSASVPIVPWPGQQALLTVHEEPQREAQQRGDAEAPPAGGRLGLKLTLPQLGAVTFVVSAQGDRVRVDAHAAQAASREALAGRAAELRDALAARALELEALAVDADAP